MTTALINADTLRIPLADQSIHMACCSPPYWGLRDYGLGDWQGGDPGCDHQIDAYLLGGGNNKGHDGSFTANYKQACGKCGATRSNPGIGLEPLHDCLGWTRRGADGTGDNCGECYVCHMRMVAAEVWRVLRDDGTFWMNLGDSYAGGNTSGKRGASSFVADAPASWGKRNPSNLGEKLTSTIGNGLKPKDLCGIPWRVALALQADGWYLRSDIIWKKVNPMPESVTDRPTKAHEYVFLLSKRARYAYDADAVREPVAPSTIGRGPVDFGGEKGRNYQPDRGDPNFRNGKEQWGRTFDYRISCASGRNRRTVWDIATQPYSGAHFATWPEALVEPMVKAGTSERGCCPVCGAQWERVVERPPIPYKDTRTPGEHTPTGDGKLSGPKMQEWLNANPAITTGFRPTCDHDAEPVPCTILDPFAGSGTTGVVARRLCRHFVGLDLSFDYLRDQARKRLALDALDAMATGDGIPGGADNLEALPLFGKPVESAGE